MLCEQMPKELDVKVSSVDRRVEFQALGPNAWIEMKTADNPASLLGVGLHGVVIDEAALIPEVVWTQYIYPTLSIARGNAVLISTPRGRNWFHKEFCRGEDDSWGDHISFTFPSYTNPYFPQEEWENAKKTLPSDVFRQEYEAEFLEDSAGVFIGVTASMVEERCGHKGPWYLGVDLAQQEDFTVITSVCQQCGSVNYIERMNRLPWQTMMDEVYKAYCRTPGKICVDETGVGSPLVESLRQRGLPITGIKLHTQIKAQVIESLSADLESGLIKIPMVSSNHKQLVNEMQSYERTFTTRGVPMYSSPRGYHDDCVISLALANWLRRCGNVFVIV